MARDTFQDKAGAPIEPINGGAPYIWPIGHESEDPEVKTTSVERTALTTGQGFVRQEGAPAPTIKKLHGWIVSPEQLAKMEMFYNACAGIGTPSRTVFYQGPGDAELHEVLITEFSPQKKVGRAGGTGLGYVWQYSITMEVIA